MDAFIYEYRRLPRFEERDHFPLLNSMQKECMRMRPISPLGLSHRVVKDSKFLNVHNWMKVHVSTCSGMPRLLDPQGNNTVCQYLCHES